MKRTLLLLVLCISVLSFQSLRAEDYKYLTVGYGSAEKSITLETIQKITFTDGKMVVTTSDGTQNYPQSELQTIYFSETATGIDNVKNADEMGEMVNGKCLYDLSGRRVTHPTRGLYIVNHKKVLVK